MDDTQLNGAGCSAEPNDDEPVPIPKGFIRLSAAMMALTRAMRGNFPQSVPENRLRADQPRVLLGYGRWRDKAVAHLRRVACDGQLPIYLAGWRPHEPVCPGAIRIPREALALLLADYEALANRPSADEPSADLQKALGPELIARLAVGVLVVHKAEFKAWYAAERAQRRIPRPRGTRQEPHSARPSGRPPIKARTLRECVLQIVAAGAWDARTMSVAKLARVIKQGGLSESFGPDTLARVVDQLWEETGNPCLQRPVKTKRR